MQGIGRRFSAMIPPSPRLGSKGQPIAEETPPCLRPLAFADNRPRGAEVSALWPGENGGELEPGWTPGALEGEAL